MSDTDSGDENRRRGKRYSERSKKSCSLRKSRSRSRSPHSRGESPVDYPEKFSRSRESRSSSRGTFDDIEDSSPPTKSRNESSPLATLRRSKSPAYYSCNQCRKTYDTIREISEHEVRAHDSTIHCYHCTKKPTSVKKLSTHTKHHHGPQPVMCGYCNEPFGKSAELMSTSDWTKFRDHIEREAVQRRMYRYGDGRPDIVGYGGGGGKGSGGPGLGMVMRGVGACPHGPPIKCRNFPHCPGHKCIYSHGNCRYVEYCNKETCPFDHPNRPRNCMSCANQMRFKSNYWKYKGQ